MTYHKDRDILEIHSYENSNNIYNNDAPNLEACIQRDFGNDGLEKFKDYRIKLTEPSNGGTRISFETEKNPIINSNEDLSTKVYEILVSGFTGVSCKNVDTIYSSEDGDKVLKFKLDLRPDRENQRYLEMQLWF